MSSNKNSAEAVSRKSETLAKPGVHFLELIGTHHDFNFTGRMNLILGVSVVMVVLSIAMLPVNHYWRGHALNYSIDFRGGSEIQVAFKNAEDPGKVREAMEEGGFPGTDVVTMKDAAHPNTFLLRFGAVSPLSSKKTDEVQASLRKAFGADSVRKFDFSEGGDKVYIRFDKSVEPEQIRKALAEAGVQNNTIQRYGRPDDNTYEIILVGLDVEVKRALTSKLGADSIVAMPAVESVGAKAGQSLRDDGIKSLLFAILCIMIYVALRFDFRYGPGTVFALLHDAILVIGAFAITYKEFSLTTIAAILTVIGYSMNDTIVVFDRIRENVSRLRDKKFDRVVNISINETLSRTIITSATVFIVTLAMNIWGTGVIRDFAFAMNIGVVVGTYSSIFVAAPVLIWLNDRVFKNAGGPKKRVKS